MTVPDIDKTFAGRIPQFYDTYMVPLIFQPYAKDMARRAASRHLSRVLEIAAGTGVLTRALAAELPEDVEIIATDLNQAMIDYAAGLEIARPVEWRQADAMALPFEDETFDAVICQFAMMFVPDKVKAFSEARRVLRTGGLFLFNVWDRIEENEFADVITTSLESIFPDNPPRFLARTPHGYHDVRVIERDLVKAGFSAAPIIETIAHRSRADSPEIPAIAYCQGTPLLNEIKERDASRLAEATDVATRAIASRFGEGAVDTKISAHIVSVTK
jgi:ubiquinone/menaquinone biosynthesis C-methylase UbiE